MRFKQYLQEQSKIITDSNQIRNWLTGSAGIYTNFTISGNGVVDMTGHVELAMKSLTYLPVQFGDVFGNFCVKNNQLSTLKGSPHKSGNFECQWNKLTSLEYAPSHIDGSLRCEENNITSLIGINEIIKKMNGTMTFDAAKIEEGGIGLILIEGLYEIYSYATLMPPHFQIIKKYFGRPEDIFECQTELIEKGYEQFAQL